MHRPTPLAGYIGRLLVVVCICEAACNVYAGHKVIDPKPSPGDPKRPAWPLSRCNGNELVKQSDEQLILGKQPGPFTSEWPNTIAVCAIMKDESAQDVKEFLEYHRWIGVDSFFIRENGETCAIQDVLEPYERAGILDFALAPGPKYPLQTNWYNECARLASKKHSWVAFIDIDEFIVVLNKQRSVTERDSLKAVLRRSYRYNAGVSMQWVLFGSGGHKEPPKVGQMQGFQRCTGELTRQMKCIGSSYWLHSSAAFRPTHVHQCNYRFGAVAAMGNSEPVDMWRVRMDTSPGLYGLSYAAHLPPEEHAPFARLTDEYQLVVFHYVTRSQDKFIERKIKLSGTGKYAEAYNALRANTTGLTEDELYARFEDAFGLNRERAICTQGAAVASVMKEAFAAGEWAPVPEEPGLVTTEPEGGSRRMVTMNFGGRWHP